MTTLHSKPKQLGMSFYLKKTENGQKLGKSLGRMTSLEKRLVKRLEHRLYKRKMSFIYMEMGFRLIK